MFDASGFFNPMRPRKDMTITKIVESSPRMQEEFQTGDIVGVIYTVSATATDPKFTPVYRFNILTAFRLVRDSLP